MFRFCHLCNELVVAGEYRAHWQRHRDEQRERPGSTWQWRALREQILARDGHRCTMCGSTTELAVHHRDHNWKNNRPQNLVSLCSRCHAARHAAA